jgi:predicted alpha/beta-fold hydrolase
VSVDDRIEKALQKLKLNRFSPYPTMRSGWAQTIMGFYLPFLKAQKPTAIHTVSLDDGDQLLVMENRPKDWKPGNRVVLLVHGLTGCYQSNYMQRMARRLSRRGALVLRLNLRSAGPGLGLARKNYHGGSSEDTRAVLKWIEKIYPGSPVTQVGFSLGANITLKMAGEDGSHPTGALDSIVAISPPLDLKESVRRIDSRESAIFRKFFIKYLVKDVKKLHKKFPELGPILVNKDMSLALFDEIFTAPRAGFNSPEEYYKECSSAKFIPEIKIPGLIIGAGDDPIAHSEALLQTPLRDNLDLILTKHGGHMGFLGFGTKWEEVRWADQAIAQWIENFLR